MRSVIGSKMLVAGSLLLGLAGVPSAQGRGVVRPGQPPLTVPTATVATAAQVQQLRTALAQVNRLLTMQQARQVQLTPLQTAQLVQYRQALMARLATVR